MHILEIPSFFPPYGGLFCLEQSKALARQGNTVRIVANVNLSARLSPRLYLLAPLKPQFIRMDGIEVVRNDMRGIPFFNKACAMHWVKTTCRLVDKYVEKYGKPDIIHAHCCQWAGYAAMLAAEKLAVPYVVTEHLSSELLVKEYGKDVNHAWQLPLIAEAYRRANLVIPVSAELVDDLEPLYGKDYRWESVSNTIDTELFAYRRRSDMRGREYRLCCIAIFFPGKGYDVLFDAVRRYRQTTADNVRLVVAGRFTDSAEAHAMVKEYGLEDVVELLGEVDKHRVVEILYDSDCLLLATRREAQGLVLLEAMSTGIPVVTTDSVPRNVRIEGGCNVVPTDDAAAMAAALQKLRSENYNDCKQASREVELLASPQVVGKRLDTLFRGIVKGK